MPVFSGMGASCKEASTSFTQASKWQINAKAATKDVTVMGAAGGWGINAATIKSFSGSVDAFFDNSDTAQTNMVGLLGQTVSMEFDTGDSTHKFTGTCLITEFDPVADVQDIIKCTYKFINGSGALAYS